MLAGSSKREIIRLPISEYQQRFFLEWMLAPEENTYNVALIYKIKGKLDKAKLIQACEAFVQNHELSHAKYNKDGSECYYKNYSINEFFHQKELDPNISINLQLREILDKPFNLTRDILLKFILLEDKKSLDEYYLVGPFTHHIVSDAYSATVFVKEVSESYNRLINGQLLSNNFKKTFTDAINAEQQLLTLEFKQKAREFWSNFIANFPLNIQLPYKSGVNFQDLNNQFANKSAKFIYFELDPLETKFLKGYARQNRTTLFIVLAAVYGLIISKYSNQNKLILSYPVNMRPKGYLGVTGCFVNNIPLKLDLEQTLGELIHNLTLQRKEIKAFQGYSLTHIVEDQMKLTQSSMGNAFNVGFAETNLNAVPLMLDYLTTEAVDIQPSNNIIYELDLQYDDNAPDTIKFRLGYREALFDKILIESFIASFKLLINKLSNHKPINCKTYCVLDEKAYEQVIHKFNSPEKAYAAKKTIHQLFEEQVLKTPNDIALVYENIELTYLQLNEKANQLANYLRHTYNIQGDDLIALFLDRNEYILVAIFGVLKAGGAYIPIDPSYPDDRISYILNDTKAKVILSNTIHSNRLVQIIEDLAVIKNTMEDKPNYPVVLELIDNQECRQVFLADKTNPRLNVKYTNLAYVLYTSGTTGKPKGVMIEHRNVANFMQSFIDYPLNSEVPFNMLSTTNYVFDVFGLEYIFPLLNGGTVHLVDLFRLSCKLNLLKYDCIQITPSKAEWLIDSIDYKICASSKHNIKLLIGGEELKQATLHKLSKLHEKLLNNQHIDFETINVYGPTETTIWSTAKKLNLVHFMKDLGNIGKPLINESIYLLDKNLNLVPIGSIGEIYIGGVGIARGYLNQPELTKEKFIANPFIRHYKEYSNSREYLYKTGDLARHLRDGSLEYIGRIDNQVKIRGHRIELGEIENVLASYPQVEQSIVLIKNNLDSKDNGYIVAYYVSPVKLDEDLLEVHLLKYLPYYMLPAIYVHLDQLPLNANGKIDRASLPEPNFIKHPDMIQPRTDLEKQIIKIWSEILGIDVKNIGINDSFYKLGGNSSLVIQLKNKLITIDQFKNLAIADLFRYTTIEQLINFITLDIPDEDIKIRQTIEASPEIAIIALSGAFSGGQNINEFWKLIQNGQEGYTTHTIDECNKLGVSKTLLENTNFISVSGHVPDIDKFDANFWGISPVEAKKLDPQTRKFLETCWFLLEDSGYINERKELSVGVFAGAGYSRYATNSKGDTESFLDIWEEATLGPASSLSTQVSYLLGLTGPSVNINTACSTSLVAVVEACQKLAQGSCDLAIAGGVSLLMPNELGYIYEDGMIFSKDGHCRAFDVNATGTVIGSGVGGVLLKRLSDARRDGDNIIAVVKGYASNNDGNRKMSYTAPSEAGQTECIVNAWEMAGVTPDQINYIECHGTGTNLGDPVEVKALHNAFKYMASKDTGCFLGSVKANIGHADIAAGIAGLIKVCKMLEYNLIPKQINYELANPEIYLDQTNFKITTAEKIWNRIDNLPRTAGVSSFGIGGTNAHVVVSEYIPENKPVNMVSNKNYKDRQINKYILPLSAKTASSLKVYKQEFIKYLEYTQDNIKDIMYTLQYKRQPFNYRTSVVCESREDAINKLNTVLSVKTNTSRAPIDIIFMFSGQGNQFINMSLPLYKNSKEYKGFMDMCISIVNKYTDVPFETVLFPELFNNANAHCDINQTRWAQIALFIVSFSLAKLLEDVLQIKPKAYIGHSIGELVSATMSGVFSLENAIFLVVSRAKLMQSMNEGSMLAISSDIDTIKEFIAQSNCEISVINSPKNYVVSGTKEQISSLKYTLDINSIQSVILKASHAYHSKAMDDAAANFPGKFAGIEMNMPVCRFISNVTGEFITHEDAISPKYWGRQIRNQVLFSQGIETIFKHYANPFFIEVGVGRSLVSAVIANAPDRLVYSVQLLNSHKENAQILDTASNEEILSKLWMNGYTNIFEKYNDSNNECQTVRLPNYCFEKKLYWLTQTTSNTNKNALQVLPKDEWLNIPVWKKIGSLFIKNTPNPNHELFLVFVEKNYTEFELLTTFNKATIFVIADNTIPDFTAIDNTHFSINPVADAAYQMLAEHLQQKNIKPTVIIHANTLSKNSFKHKVGQTEEYLNKGFYSLFLIQQFILSKLYEVKFVVLTQEIAKVSDKDIVNPSNGSMVAAIRTIKHELMNIKTCILDVGDYVSHNPGQILEFIGNDNNFIEDNLYAIRFNSLWIESFEKMTFSSREPMINNDDVILITGGLGGIGLSIAQAISEKNKVKFILVSRNNIQNIKEPSQYVMSQLGVLKNIESLGSTIDIQCLDIADLSKARKLIKHIIKEYGKLSGVIHAAGTIPLPSDARSLANIKIAIRAKIHGVANLANIANKIDLQYFVMISSLASIMGDVNRIEYCAANGYLDYVPLSKLLPPNCRTLTINWPGWLDVGMVVENAMHSPPVDINKAVMLNTVTKIEGVALFCELIQYRGQEQIIISKLKPDVLAQTLFREVKSVAIDKVVASVLEENLPSLYYKIAGIFLELLEVDQISIYDNFFNLGGTSLSAMKLIARLKQNNINISLADIITINSIDSIYKKYESNDLGASTDKILIPLALNNHSGKNVFFIHAVGGSVVFYLDMVKKLSKQYNYYGIQNINIFGKQLISPDTFEDLAKIYLNEILKVQADGEYILMGSSLGGTMSYEIARQLIKLGKTVKYIMMFDSWAVFSDHFKDEKIFQTIMEDQVQYDRTAKNFGEAVDYQALSSARWKLMRLLLNYQPVKESIKLYLYKANELDKNHITIGKYPENGWQQYTDMQVTVFNITGTHNTIHIEPGLGQIVKSLNNILDNDNKSMVQSDSNVLTDVSHVIMHQKRPDSNFSS